MSNSMSTSSQAPASRVLTQTLGVAYIVLAALLVYTLAAFWPIVIRIEAGTGAPVWLEQVQWFGLTFSVLAEQRLLWIVVIAAAMGSYVHAVTSFASYVGNQNLAGSWMWWYVLRTPIGVSLALVFYFVVRGGFFSSGAVATDMSPFGVAALSGMVGMFSKQAADKLREIFDNLFRAAPGKGDDVRRDKLETPAPTITSIDPKSAVEGSPEVMLTITGSNFGQDAVILVNGIERETTFRSPTQLVAHLSPEDTASQGTLTIAVKPTRLSEQQSNIVRLEVRPRP